jgi:putative hydrolase
MMQAMQSFFTSEGPVNWEVAHQMGGAVALTDTETGEQVEQGWNAADGDRIEELARLAQSHVAETTGLVAVHAIPIKVISRRDWTASTLRDLKPVIEALAVALRGPDDGVPALEEPAADPTSPMAFMGGADLSNILGALTPVLLGAQAGSMVGYLAHHALGRLDLSLPLDSDPEIAFVLVNVDEFTNEWSLERDDVYLSLALRETVRAAQRSLRWVRTGLVDRAIAFVSGYRPDASAIDERFAGLNLGDPESLQEQLGDPAALLGMMRTPEQAVTLDELQRYVAVIEGYTDTVTDSIGSKLIASHGMVDEALRRQRLERGQAATFAEQMLGLELTREHFERGQQFCEGVVEREGIAGLNRLWTGPEMLPTPPELDAPGLWLARIDL